MKLYLVQHGNQLSKDIDPEESLSNKGRSDCEKVALYVANEGIKVNAIFHSVKLRAKQTAEIFAKHLLSGGQTEEKEGLKPMDDVTVWVDQLHDGLMLVGHLPFMQKISSLLLTGNAEKPIIEFRQGGIVCLEKNEDGNWSMRFMITPDLST